MARVFVTGSTGLGSAAAQALLDDGHEVVVHARTDQRAAVRRALRPPSPGAAVADEWFSASR